MKPIARTLRTLGALLFLAAAAAPAAVAQAQTDMTDPTAWRWRRNVDLAQIQDDVADGYRIVDIEVEGTAPFRLSASYVRNAGPYQKSWWWYYGLTSTEVNQRMGQNGARLIDVEPYETVVGIRYAVVMVANAGVDHATSHGWNTNMTFSDVASFRPSHPNRRIIDVQPYMVGGARRYAIVWVANSGNTFESDWSLLLNTSMQVVSDHLASGPWRLLDLEIEDGTGNVSAITVPRDGLGWYWFTNLQGDDVGTFAGQYASRIMDLERYTTASGAVRYGIVVRPNDNDLTVETMARQRERLPLSARSGFLLREFNGATSTLAGVFENRVFAPASTLKTAYHVTAMNYAALGLVDLDALITVNTGTSGSCPNGSAPVQRTMRSALRRMMEQSSNPDTEAIRAYFGDGTILSTCAFFGATNIAINSTIGCACTQNLNEVTLMDLANLHEAVIDGGLGEQRDEFYDLMLNGSDFGMGAFSTADVLQQELAASSLTQIERDSFLAGTRFAHKGGSYSCSPGGDPVRQRSRAAYVRLPFRSGCDTDMREFFIGAWVNWGDETVATEDAVGVAMAHLFRDRVRAAVQSWEAAGCNPFEIYCLSRPNSTGLTAIPGASGSPYVLDNDLTLTALRVPPHQFGSLILSDTAGFTPFAGNSEGNLCLGGSIVRYPGSLQSSGASGTMTISPNLNWIPTNAGTITPVQHGDTLLFQWWFRDRTQSGFPTSNFTSGLRVTFI